MKNRNILFISYYFDPYPTVAALRNTYWAEHLSSIRPLLSSYVFTSTKQSRAATRKPGIEKIYYIPDTQKKSPLSLLIQDEGISWSHDIKQFLQSTDLPSFDYVIITGGPFLHFSLISTLKKKWNCKVILDYRDPFAHNPKFKPSFLKNTIKYMLEGYFNQQADAVITINKKRAEIINCKESSKLHVIDNGYPELLTDATLSQHTPLHDIGISCVYTGRLYEDSHRCLQNFCRVISEDNFLNNFRFAYYGQSYDMVYQLLKDQSGRFEIHKPIPQSKLLSEINRFSLGIIFTGGTPLESPTKLFDYIGLEKPVLIVSAGKLGTGSLGELSQEAGEVYWCGGEEEDIRKALYSLQNRNLAVQRKNRTNFSRRAGLHKLVEVIEKLDSGVDKAWEKREKQVKD